MSDAGNNYKALRIVDGVDDPIVPDPDAVDVTAGELDCSHWTRVGAERVDSGASSVADRTLKPAVLASRRRMETDLVLGLC